MVTEASRIKALRLAVDSNGVALEATEAGGRCPAGTPAMGTNLRKLFTQPL